MACLVKQRIVFACDNQQTVDAIKYGSNVPLIQFAAECIFAWCLEHNKCCWPVWLPREHRIMKLADRRSRLKIPHDQQSPAEVIAIANSMALNLWGSPLSFDQAASHLSAISIDGKKLPFNAFCHQPGASGVDMFRQWSSWLNNINYVYPPRPMIGRTASFLPTTRARSILVFEEPMPVSWWSFATGPGAPGLVARTRKHGFFILAYDFSK